MFILDTNVVSEIFRPAPDQRVADWFKRASPPQLFVTAISKAESLLGLAMMPDGKRKQALDEAMRTFFEDRLKTPILPFGDRETRFFADLVSNRRRAGLPIGEFDAQIAAIAKSRGFAVVTRNVNDFEHCGIGIINPWEAAS